MNPFLEPMFLQCFTAADSLRHIKSLNNKQDKNNNNKWKPFSACSLLPWQQNHNEMHTVFAVVTGRLRRTCPRDQGQRFNNRF